MPLGSAKMTAAIPHMFYKEETLGGWKKKGKRKGTKVTLGLGKLMLWQVDWAYNMRSALFF